MMGKRDRERGGGKERGKVREGGERKDREKERERGERKERVREGEGKRRKEPWLREEKSQSERQEMWANEDG